MAYEGTEKYFFNGLQIQLHKNWPKNVSVVLTVENPIFSRFRRAGLFLLEELLSSTCQRKTSAQNNETIQSAVSASRTHHMSHVSRATHVKCDAGRFLHVTSRCAGCKASTDHGSEKKAP